MKISRVLIFLFISACNQPTARQDLEHLSLPSDLNGIRQILDSIHVEDQKYRNEIEALIEEYGWESAEMRNHWEKISTTDSSNLVIVEQVLDEYGWLGSDQIGYKANSTLFLVIQHSGQVHRTCLKRTL